MTDPRAARAPRLFGVLVAVGDYSKARLRSGKPPGNLQFTRRDAEAMLASWQGQKGKTFRDVRLVLCADQEARRDKVLQELKAVGEQVQPDDRVFLYFAGHGDLADKGARAEFVYCCVDFDQGRSAATGLSSRDLADAIAAINCRKVVFLDTCHSGAVLNPIRDLTPGRLGPILFASCDRPQKSYEISDLHHGLFTYAILDALDQRVRRDGGQLGTPLDTHGLMRHLRVRMPELLEKFDPNAQQTPICFPEPVDPLLLSK